MGGSVATSWRETAGGQVWVETHTHWSAAELPQVADPSLDNLQREGECQLGKTGNEK